MLSSGKSVGFRISISLLFSLRSEVASLALALELPPARELDAAPAPGLLGRLALVLRDVDPGDGELVALLDVAVRDELERVRGLEDGAGGGVT